MSIALQAFSLPSGFECLEYLNKHPSKTLYFQDVIVNNILQTGPSTTFPLRR